MKIEYDTHGITSDCPQRGEQLSAECLACPFFKGSEGFVAECCYDQSWLDVWEALDEKARREQIHA